MPGISIEQDDVCIYVTEACNSNCIMCPMSLDARKRGNTITHSQWEDIENIPDDTPHITITGGEPFLEYTKLIPVLGKLNDRFPHSEKLILTNGRAFALDDVFNQIKPLLTDRYWIAIPIHASSAELHDHITQTAGSFRQSMKAIHRLADTKAKIEIRIVGHRLNAEDISRTFQTVVDNCPHVRVINLVAMEMTGCAARNRQELWVDYSEICIKAKAGIHYAAHHGINVGLYNFPLCTIPEELWPLAKMSITPYKVRFDAQCENCIEQEACGGMFYSTYELKLVQAKPIQRMDEQ